MRDRVIGQIPMVVGFSLESAEVRRDKVYLKLRSPGGDLRELVTEHVVAATGFRSSLERFQFLSVDIRSKLRAVNETPILSRSMESSIPGLYFMGPIAAHSFGPVMRFAYGAQFSAVRVTKALGYT